MRRALLDFEEARNNRRLKWRQIPPPIPDLPQEILTEIFLKIDPASIVKNVSCVDRSWRSVATSDHLFKQKLKQHFAEELGGSQSSISHDKTYLGLFDQRVQEKYASFSPAVKKWYLLLKEGDIYRIKQLELNIVDILPSLRKHDDQCIFNFIRHNQILRNFLFERIYQKINSQLVSSMLDGYYIEAYLGMLGPSAAFLNELLPNFDASVTRHNRRNHSALFHAAQRGLVDTCEYLLDRGASMDDSGERAKPLFYTAAEQGHVDILELFYRRGITDVDAPKFSNKYTALYIAAQRGHMEAVKFLLARGANPNFRCPEGSTPLYIAAQQGYADIVKLLHQRGAQASVNDLRFGDGFTPLYVACRNGHKAVVETLIELDADIEANGGDGSSPLYVAAQNAHTEVVQLLLAKGARVDVPFLGGYTALYIAAQNGSHEIVQLLVERGADIDLISPNGSTALYVASQNGRELVVKYLLHGGASSSIYYAQGYGPLYVACQKGHKAVVELLLAGVENINSQTIRGATAVYVASQKGHIEIVRLLLVHGADPRIKFQNGYTALHIACVENRVDVVMALVDACPALLTIKDNHSKTSLEVLEQEYGSFRRIIDYLKLEMQKLENIEDGDDMELDSPGRYCC